MHSSIRVKLTLILAILLMLSSLLQGFVQSFQLERMFLESTRSRLFAQARQITILLSQPTLSQQDRQTVISEMAAQGDARITIILADGSVLADSEESPDKMENHHDREEIMEALEAGEGWAVRHSGTIDLPMLYTAVAGLQLPEGPALVRLALPLNIVQAAVAQLWQIVFSAIIIALAIGIAIAIWQSRKFTMPIEQLTTAAQKMAAGDLSQRVHFEANDELGTLADSFNRLARSNEERFRELSNAKAHLETVLQNTVSGIFLLNQKGTVLLSNPSAMKMLGFEGVELPAPHWQVTRNYQMSQALEQALRETNHYKADVEITTPAERIVELNVVPLPSSEQYVAVFYDVSESRRLASIRADLVANVSHELKTPVTSIHGFAETLLQGALDDEKSRRRFVEIIFRESKRLLMLVTDLLDLSRLELDSQAVDKREIDLVKVIEEVIDRATIKAEEKSVSLKLIVGVETAKLQADDYRLGQALGNLIDNALKYTPVNGDIRITLQFDRGAYYITVRDTGIGIAPEHLERIFERFYRTDKGRSRLHGGTGLGLAIVKHIVELHGGEVWAESKVGQGTAFTMRLPLPAK